MADVTVTAPAIAHHGSTPAGGADRVDFGTDLPSVWIKHRDGAATDGLWWTVGGTAGDDPAVPAALDGKSRWLPPGGAVELAPETAEPTRVRVFAASAQPYSVEAG